MIGTARATPVARLPAARGARDGPVGGDPPADRRPRPRRRLQRADHPARRSSSSARCARRAPTSAGSSSGKKGRSTLRFRRYEIEQAWVDFTDRPVYADAVAIAHTLAELFTEREVDRVVMVYNHYVSPLTQTVEVEDVLPIPRTLLEEEEKSAYEIALEGDFIYEPEPEEILARLLPTYLETSVYRALLESAASEHGARMTAMRNASKNAGELIDRLTLDMNRARQSEITQEILEVVAGADALTYVALTHGSARASDSMMRAPRSRGRRRAGRRWRPSLGTLGDGSEEAQAAPWSSRSPCPSGAATSPRPRSAGRSTRPEGWWARPGRPLDLLARYDPATDSWETLQPAARSRSRRGAARPSTARSTSSAGRPRTEHGRRVRLRPGDGRRGARARPFRSRASTTRRSSWAARSTSSAATSRARSARTSSSTTPPTDSWSEGRSSRSPTTPSTRSPSTERSG